MGVLESCTASGQHIEFTPYAGIIEDLQNWTTTQSWSEGGGGYVHPTYGGWVEAPTIRTHSTHHVRVRVLWDGGRRSTLDLPGHVQLSMGDKAIFMVAENKAAKVWQWCGVANQTTETWFGIGDLKDVAKVKVTGVLNHLGMIFFSLAHSTGDARASALGMMLVGGILSLILAFPLQFVMGVFVRRASFGDAFWTAAVAVGIATFVGSRKVLAEVKEADAQYKGARTKALKMALESALRAPSVEVQPA